MENEKYLVMYVTKDLNGVNWIHRQKEFYFKDEATLYAISMEEKTKQKVHVYKLITKKELVY